MTAWYNENDPYPAQWLRNLSAAGHIAEGTVDERSILEVDPAELTGYAQCHFFAGIGGWPHALRLAGIPDDFPVWTGSCPCQPFSAAGKRKGHEDERHLWPAWFRLIRERRPPTIFGEQVASKSGLAWFDAVRADLESEGYAVAAADLCAASVGAPHIRQRLFFVAYAGGERRQQINRGAPSDEDSYGRARRNGGQEEGDHFAPGCVATRILADDDERGRALEQATRLHDRRQSGDDADGCGEPRRLAVAGGPERRARRAGRARAIGGRAHAQPSGSGEDGIVGNPAVEGLRCGRRAESNVLDESGDRALFGMGDAASEQARGTGQPRENFWRPCDWLPCRDGKARPVEPGTFPLAHGVTARVGKLRAYGNAIVPQVAAEFVKAALCF